MAGAYSVTSFHHFVILSFRPSVIPDSVSAHYLSHTWRFSNQIWYIGLSPEYAGWVRIWVRSNNFWQSYASWTWKNSINFQFPLIISITNWHFELKFGIKMCHENMQVEFEFGSGQIIFSRVMPLGLRKIPLIFSFRSLSPLQIYILNWNSVYRCVVRICRLSSNLCPVK